MTVILVSHSMEDVAKYVDRIIRDEQRGSPDGPDPEGSV